MIQTKNICFSKHQNKAKIRNQDDSAVISSDFPGLCSLNDPYSLKSLSGLNDLDSLISSKKLLILMVRSPLSPKLSKPVPFCGMDQQKSNFLPISGTLSFGGF